MSESDEAIRAARAALRRLLSSLHVLDALPERSRLLAVDANLPVHTVLTVVLSEQHPRMRSAHVNQGPQGAAGAPGATPNPSGTPLEETGQPGGGQMRREGPATEHSLLLSYGVVSPSLPSNVLAEVCEFDTPGKLRGDVALPGPTEDGTDEKTPAVRRWTSPDDGWGMNLPMQDLEKMPMGMPVTVGELADFLVHACESTPAEAKPKGIADGTSQRWAEPVGVNSTAKVSEEKRKPAKQPRDMLDWTLSQWRAHRLKISGHTDSEPPPSNPVESASRLFVEERPRSSGPVLVHRVPLAPPRPILCTDDPEASLLKAVELLLAYPELDALPIVSPVRCTVVAHLTLSYCLAFILSRLRGPELSPLANLMVGAQEVDGGGPPEHRVFSSPSSPESGRPDSWAERRTPAAQQLPPWVLRRSQPLRELLMFFARTHHSGVPVVEESGGVLGLLSRRDLLHFLDLAMQSQRRCEDGNDNAASIETDGVTFDTAAPVEAVLDALQRFRGQAITDEGVSTSPLPGANTCVGATFVYEKQLSLKALLLRVLGAKNRKLLFVKDNGGSLPQLLRVLSVGDVWHLLIGCDQELAEHTGNAGDEPLVATDI